MSATATQTSETFSLSSILERFKRAGTRRQSVIAWITKAGPANIIQEERDQTTILPRPPARETNARPFLRMR